MLIRPADNADLPGILAIHNDAVLHGTAIWSETPSDLAERSAWLAERTAAGYPVLVAQDPAGAVLAFASYGPWRSLEGFRQTVELSLYVRADQHRRGIGSALLQALIEHARGAGRHVLVAAIEAQNQASIGLHQRHGFTCSGQLQQVGRKFGRWLDLTFMQLILE